MTGRSETRAPDLGLRILEGIVMAPLTFAFMAVATKLPEGDVSDIGFWLIVLGVWGLLALWWLIVAVNPYSPLPKRLPWLVWAGLAAGTLCVAGFLYGGVVNSRSGWETLLFYFAVWLIPVVILADRLVRLWKHRGFRARTGSSGAV